MNKIELKKEVIENQNFVQEFYKDSRNQAFTTMFIIKAKEKGKDMNVVGVPGNDETFKERHRMVFEQGVKFGLKVARKELDSVEGIFMMSEAWMSRAPRDKNNIPNIKPSEDPKRVEAFISSGMSDEGDSYVAVFEMKRVFDFKINQAKVLLEVIPEEKDEKDKGGLSSESPLLESFWMGFGLPKFLYANLPKGHLESETLKAMSFEDEYAMIMTNIYQAQEALKINKK